MFVGVAGAGNGVRAVRCFRGGVRSLVVKRPRKDDRRRDPPALL